MYAGAGTGNVIVEETAPGATSEVRRRSGRKRAKAHIVNMGNTCTCGIASVLIITYS